MATASASVLGVLGPRSCCRAWTMPLNGHGGAGSTWSQRLLPSIQLTGLPLPTRQWLGAAYARSLSSSQPQSTTHSINTPPLVSTAWLASALEDKSNRIVILDASWQFHSVDEFDRRPTGLFAWLQQVFNPAAAISDEIEQLSPQALFDKHHIKEARFSGLESFTDQLSSLPNMLQSDQEFSKTMGRLGISPEDHVVVYDHMGIYSSQEHGGHFGVLDGGLPKWIREGRALEHTNATINETLYPVPKTTTDIMIEQQELMMHITDFTNSKPYVVLDARSQKRFSGNDGEPRNNIKSGHIPSSINIPYTDLVEHDGTLKNVELLKHEFESRSLDIQRRSFVTMSGSGVSAAIIYLALEVVGHKMERFLFDGSWTEWASGGKSPIKKWN
ncbi:hypothetical protein BASA83_001200 [Batrachochytrium salamandrivorans]|nr:hypothetical protein BASA83_001200 [Batrachochytrium salamandrivorans]